MQQNNNLTLWYPRPARQWVEALPVGSGRLGAMVFGGLGAERLQLNEDTLWSGGPREWDNPAAPQALAEVRRLIFEGKFVQADAACKRMQGPFNQSYLPLGDLLLDFEIDEARCTAYSRELNLDTAVATTRFELDGVTYTREVFASYPDQVIVIHLACSAPGKLTLTARLESPLHFSVAPDGSDLLLQGKCPVQVDPSYLGATADPVVYDPEDGMRFEIRLHAEHTGGRLSVDERGLGIADADEVTLLVAGATSFNGFDRNPAREGKDPARLTRSGLAAAAAWGYPELYERHVSDHQSLFRRVELELGTPGAESRLPTDERVRRFAQTQDPQLAVLLFQYGRYLLIASSRPGTQPANLQGIWNDEVRPPWSSNYTININTQMNYWPAETTNLAECHLPLLDFLADLAENGRKTARTNYQAQGWVAHHNADLWRQTAPVGAYGSGRPGLGQLVHGRRLVVPAFMGALCLQRGCEIPARHGLPADEGRG